MLLSQLAVPSARLDVLFHVVGVIVFLGNFVAAWLAFVVARRQEHAAALASLFALVNLGDRWLTPASLLAIVASGVHAAGRRGISITGTGWILWSLVALGISGVVFVARLRGLQLELEAAARAPTLDLPAFRVRLHRWAVWAAVGTVAAVSSLALMVLQPDLPGF